MTRQGRHEKEIVITHDLRSTQLLFQFMEQLAQAVTLPPAIWLTPKELNGLGAREPVWPMPED